MTALQYREFGVITKIRGCLLHVEGLENCINGQIVRCGYGTMGIVIGFDEHETQVLIVKQKDNIKTGDKVVMTLEPFDMQVGEGFIGRVINPLGEVMDDLGTLVSTEQLPIFGEPPSVLDRKEVTDTVETGIKVIDTMIPIGKGQRQLILGDKMTGKTVIGTDTILNQKGKDIKCIYCCIGKSKTALDRIVNLFKSHDAFDYTMVVAAIAGTSPGLQYLAPYVSCALGEFFMKKGGHVVVVFDDFTKHAWAYRELSLLLGRPPGRESYPGDVFYLHSRMIERAAQMSDELGGGSMTFFPIVETLEGDVTGYIVTNLISMTDGQIVLSAPLFAEGFKPAIDIGLSVSRIGNKAQWPALRKSTKPLKLNYIQYRELLKMAALQAGEQSPEAQEEMRGGEILTMLLKQVNDNPLDVTEEVILFYGYDKKLIYKLTDEEIERVKSEIYEFAKEKYPDVVREITKTKELSEETDKMLGELYSKFVGMLMEKRPAEENEEKAVTEET